ncbi:MAG TPA: Wzz/FepE/Etk N-terminal domain-containing protein [Kiloniellaceae bacterium]|nr:Wzz/FepE/Etk N-terminal domain-containing protein [Kiloniellaceae bacterium]
MLIAVDGIHGYVSILKRRRWHLLLPAALVVAISLVVAVIWPPSYLSSATILIEEQEVPRDLVQSTVTSYADERLQVITQRVMTSENLVSIIKEFDLYQKERQAIPINTVAADMREELEFALVSADVVDPRSGRPTQATIAFTLSFYYRSPKVAQLVVNKLVSLYLDKNLEARKDKAAETTGFLKDEAERFSQEVQAMEAKLAAFKSEHNGNLPEQNAINLQFMERTERELANLRRQLQEAGEREIFLQAQLAQVSPYEVSVVDGVRVASPDAQLRDLETRLITLQGVYGPDHPDVRKVKREIKALRTETGVGPDIGELYARRDAIAADMAVARERYSADHPDVTKLQRQLDSVNAAITDARNNPAPTPKRSSPPNNPAYIQIQAQLDALRLQKNSFNAEYAMLQDKMRTYEARALDAPEIEREYNLLQRDYETALGKLQDVKAKLSQAELGEQLEKQSKSERFTLVEPATLPTRPESPNRIAILLLGVVLAVAVGIGTVFLAELFDKAVYGPRQLAAITGSSPLVVVPYITNGRDTRRVWGRRMAYGAGVTLSLAVVLYWFQDHGPPLDVLQAIFERRIEGILSKF